MKTKEIIESLKNLTPKQLLEIEGRIELIKQEQPSSLPPHFLVFWDEIVKELEQRNQEFPKHVKYLQNKNVKLYKKILQIQAKLEILLSRYLPETKPDLQLRVGIYRLWLSSAIFKLSKANIPFSLITLVNVSEDIYTLVNDSLPYFGNVPEPFLKSMILKFSKAEGIIE